MTKSFLWILFCKEPIVGRVGTCNGATIFFVWSLREMCFIFVKFSQVYQS